MSRDRVLDEDLSLILGLKSVADCLFLDKSAFTDAIATKVTKWCLIYSCAIPDVCLLNVIERVARDRLVVDIYSRNGYWALMMSLFGVKVMAGDMEPVSEQLQFFPVLNKKSDVLCSQMDLSEAIVFYGFPFYVTADYDPLGISYFPELLIWKGNCIMAIVDRTEHEYAVYKVGDTPKKQPLTGDVLKAANELTGCKWRTVISRPLKYKVVNSEHPVFEVYVRV